MSLTILDELRLFDGINFLPRHRINLIDAGKGKFLGIVCIDVEALLLSWSKTCDSIDLS
jgi:hypothetical protein